MKEQHSEHETRKQQHMPGSGRAGVQAFSPKIKSKIMSKWSKISETDVDAMNGNFSMLASKIQEIYSYPKAKAEKECEEFKRANKMQ